MNLIYYLIIIAILSSIIFTGLFYFYGDLHAQECDDLGQKVLDIFTCRDYTDEEELVMRRIG